VSDRKTPKKSRKNVPAAAERQPRVERGHWPGTDRTPRRAHRFVPPDPTDKVVVQFGRCDVGSPWCLTKITPADHVTLLDRISSFETMKVVEAFNSNDEPGKDYEVARLPSKEASDRLVELEFDDEDYISRLRITGKGRLYGFRRSERFYALWWDPEHEIWPSRKRNT